MKIVIDARLSQMPRGGVGLYIEKLVQNLAFLDKTNDYFLILNPALPLDHIPDQPNFKQLLTSVQVNHSVRRELWEQLKLPYLLWKLDADVYHGTNFSLPILLPCPGIASIYDLSTWLFPAFYPRLTRWRQSFFSWFAARRASAVVTISQASQQDFVRLTGYDSEQMYVVSPALDTVYQNPFSTEYLSRLKERLSITKDYIIHIGVIHPRKNVLGLVEAFALANDCLNHAYQLVQVGEPGWQYHEVLALIDDLGLTDEVCLTGHMATTDLYHLLRGARAFVFPSLYEGFGIPLLEAMACQVPIITSDVSSLPEVAGPAALLVDPTDVGTLAEQIETILTNEKVRADLIAAGQEQLKKFDWQQSARQLLEIYQRYANC